MRHTSDRSANGVLRLTDTLDASQALSQLRTLRLPSEKATILVKVVVYSHDADVRAQMRLAIGRRPEPDVPDAEIIECATEPALFRLLDEGGAAVMVLDGEAQPAGGMGVCRQAKDEIYDCPPVLLITGRVDDGWLATWSRADAVISHPIDPRQLAGELSGLMRRRAGRSEITSA
jgi:DNA-binding response OmpR family regulator